MRRVNQVSIGEILLVNPKLSSQILPSKIGNENELKI